MADVDRITCWLHHLRELMPPCGVTLIGAGNGSSAWIRLLGSWALSNVTLFEADEKRYRVLQQTSVHPGWMLRSEVVAEKAEAVTFHIASHTAESGLLHPKELHTLWPNIDVLQHQTRTAVTLSAVQEGSALRSNWLIVDCLPSIPIIKGASETLFNFDVIVARVLLGSCPTPESESNHGELKRFLKERGYRCVAIERERQPAIGHALYVRDKNAEVCVLRKNVSELQQELAVQSNKNAVIEKHYNRVESQLQKHVEELAVNRKLLDSSFKAEILNSTKQLEAFLSVQNYLNTGNLSGSMHGWPISPDFALYLVELLEKNDYDLVIEFGSGTSTVLVGKVLAKLSNRRQGKPATRQVAFEHLPQYHEQTSANLRQAGLADAVQLVLAPLQSFRALNGNTYSYYDFHDALTELGREMSHCGLRILALVDGPPTTVGKHARYPALSAVLPSFPGAYIDIVLDDYIREDEKQIAKLWLDELNAMALKPIFAEKKLEKDACLLSVQT